MVRPAFVLKSSAELVKLGHSLTECLQRAGMDVTGMSDPHIPTPEEWDALHGKF